VGIRRHEDAVAPLTPVSYFVRSVLGQQRAPQPLALLQDSYRKIDDLNGLRWAFEGMKTQMKRWVMMGLVSIFFDAKFEVGAD
jgi:hypothetical protein